MDRSLESKFFFPSFDKSISDMLSESGIEFASVWVSSHSLQKFNHLGEVAIIKIKSIIIKRGGRFIV